MELIINEMILRDGLQSLKKIYSCEQKYLIYKELEDLGITDIEFGSMTSEKILPQMSGSIDLYQKIMLNLKNDKTKLIMLCPSLNTVKISVDKGIKQFGLLCSISNKFSWKNMNMSKEDSINKMLSQFEYIINLDFDLVRIYLSCSFGSDWDFVDDEYIEYLFDVIDKIYFVCNKKNISSKNVDIVISDTFGLVNEELIIKIYNNLEKRFTKKIFEYIALHLHTEQEITSTNYNRSVRFKKFIKISLDYGIKKYDSSILGIGGCPFGENNLKGNLSTYELYSFLSELDYKLNIDLKKLEESSFRIKKILDN